MLCTNVNSKLSCTDKEKLQESRVWDHKLCHNILFDVLNMASLGYYSEQNVSSFEYTNSSFTVWQNKFFALGLKLILFFSLSHVFVS